MLDALEVSASFLRAAFGGASASYSLRLIHPCSSVVVVHLLLPSDATVRLSSDRLCFTPDNCQQPQLVRVEALENRPQWSVITHRLFSLDRNYDRVETPNVVVQTEATPLECPLLTFGGLKSKRKAAAMGASQSTRLDILAALPVVTNEVVSFEFADGGAAVAAQSQDASWCVSHLASGNHFSVAAVVQPKGTTLLSWGINTNGELGNGTMTSSPTPQQVAAFPMQVKREPLTIANISCGKHHVAVITGQARLFTWGCNKYGQLGLGDFTPRTLPEEVHFALATLSSHRRALRVMHTVQRGGNNVTHVACGADHTLFVTHQQQILGMGYNQAGQLGLGHHLHQYKSWRSCSPIAIEALRDQSILDLAAGQNHSACALSNGDVYTWGCGDDGRLGDGKLGEGVATPTLITFLKNASVRARAVRCGARHMAVISDNDLLYLWGANDFGQLGCKDQKPRSRPFLLTTLTLFTEGVEDVALGEFHTTCVTSAGKAYSWGLNLRDNIALIGSHDSPQLIELPEKERVRTISCGWTHTNIVTHISAEEASASGQGTIFDKKMERERFLQRKTEAARWKDFVASSTSHKSKLHVDRRSELGKRLSINGAITEAPKLELNHSDQSNTFGLVEYTKSLQKIENSLKKLVVSYTDDAMKEAKKNMMQHFRVVRRTISRSAKSKCNSYGTESPSLQCKGLFYRNQLRPPELPVTTNFSPILHRKLWSAPGTLVSVSTPFRPKPPLSSSRNANLLKPNVLETELQVPERDRKAANYGSNHAVGTNFTLSHSARSPEFKRTANPSPRSKATVYKALMHQSTYSITEGALASVRSRFQSLYLSMADAYRAKVTTSNSKKAANSVKGKTTGSKNQQVPGGTQTSVLPRINQRSELLQKFSAAPQLQTKNNDILPCRRSSIKNLSTIENNSPIEEPFAKSAWCTPREASELPTGSHIASFFAEPEGTSGYEGVSTTLRLRSVEESMSVNEERYRIDMEHLASNNVKFFEISVSANQHIEHMSSQLPNISETFEQTSSALQSLSSDIATLHQQHESARKEMENQFKETMNNTVDEILGFNEAHAVEKMELIQIHERERQEVEKVFHDKIAELESKCIQMKKHYLQKLQELRQISESEIQTLQESNRVGKEEQERLARVDNESLQAKAKRELEDLQSSTATAFQELQERSQSEFVYLQRTTTEELAAVRNSLTNEIMTLKQKSALNLAALGDRAASELQELREESDEALHKLKQFYLKEQSKLLEKASEEIGNLHMLEIDQSTRMERRRYRETRALREELEAARTNYSTHIQQLHRRYTSEMEVLKATSKGEKGLLPQEHASKIAELQATAAQELSQTISSYQSKLNSISEENATKEDRNKKEAAQARESMIAKYESDLSSLQNERMREKDALILRYETELEAMKQSSREEQDTTVKLYEMEVAQLREVLSSKILTLEMTVREQNKQAGDTIREKDGELEKKQARINVLEASESYLKDHHKQYAERSLELIEQKTMVFCELESEIWRLNRLNGEKDAILEDVNHAVKVANEDLQVKANTIVELTFVVKSRDDEIEKLRNALLDTVQTVNTKTEILELTTETLSTKARELEVIKNALRLESGKLSVVEESMHEKEEILENTELKMENMRLEMKRMQMDMKLQLEHTEGEIELKNGEIRRLHGRQSELKQKNDFYQQTVDRLETSLAFAQRQGEEAQRRTELLRLEATQTSEELKKTCDELLGKEQELFVITREKQTISGEKQRLQIQLNNLMNLSQLLREKVEIYAMQAEEIQCQSQKLLENSLTKHDERMRSEKHLHMLELSAAKDVIQHLEGVEERFSATSLTLNTVTSEKMRLEVEVQTLNDSLNKFKDTDRLLCAANEEIHLKNKFIEDNLQELARLNEQVRKCEANACYELNSSQMKMEDILSLSHRLMDSKNEAIRHHESLESIITSLRVEKEKLVLSLGQEKLKIVNEAENLQEKVAGLRKEGVLAANDLSDLQHALNEKKKELVYLQENLGEQTSDTRKLKRVLDALTNSHTELQDQFQALSSQRESENQEHLRTIQSLKDDLESQKKERELLQRSLDIKREEIDVLMIQHGSHVMELADSHRSEEMQLVESHLAQIAQITQTTDNHIIKLNLTHEAQVIQLKDDHLLQTTQLILDNMIQVTQLTEEHQREKNFLTGEHQTEIAQFSARITTLTEEHRAEVDPLKDEISRLTNDLYYQVSELTVDRSSQMLTEQTEEHPNQVSRLQNDCKNEITRLKEEHRCEVNQLLEAHQNHMRADSFNLLQKENVAADTSIAADEHVRLVCAYSLEIMTIHVEHRQEMASLEQQAAETQQALTEQLTTIQSQNSHLKAEVNQLLEHGNKMEAEYAEQEVSSSKVVTSVDDVCELLCEQDRVISALAQLQPSQVSPSQQATIGHVFTVIDQLLTRAREVTKNDRFMRLEDLTILFDEWEERDCSKSAQLVMAAENNLYSTEILTIRQEAADFIQRCKDALQLESDGIYYSDEIIEAIEQLMKIVNHFELLQPKLGRHSTASDQVTTLENKVTAVLAFVDELRLMADFAQNILDDEIKSHSEPESNESSRSNLESLRVLTPTSTLEELQIGLEIAVDDPMQEIDRNCYDFSTEESKKQQETSFSASTNMATLRSSSPFLADSLMDISLVLSDHHQLLSQTARWVAKSRPNSAFGQTYSVGTEISRLVREHCALLSLSRRLFQMQDPQSELVSLLESVALLDQMTGRLKLFQLSSSQDTEEMNIPSLLDSYCGELNWSESSKLLGKSDNDSIPLLESIGDMARHLQDYDYFLRQVNVNANESGNDNNSSTAINIEKLVQEINEQLNLVDQSKELLGLQNPVDELLQFLSGSQEVLRQAKQLREASVSFEKSIEKCEIEPQDVDLVNETEQFSNGIEGMLSEMDLVVDDLRNYNDLVALTKQFLPQPEAVNSVADLKEVLDQMKQQQRTCIEIPRQQTDEEYYRRLLDERKEIELAQTASVEKLREELKALRLKLNGLEQQTQFRPSSSKSYTCSPRTAGMSVQTPRVLKTAVVSNTPRPMRPERPRGGGSAHKERIVSDLERESGLRRTNSTPLQWKVREEMITENPGSQLEQNFRAM